MICRGHRWKLPRYRSFSSNRARGWRDGNWCE